MMLGPDFFAAFSDALALFVALEIKLEERVFALERSSATRPFGLCAAACVDVFF